jgi:uridylate kinase
MSKDDKPLRSALEIALEKAERIANDPNIPVYSSKLQPKTYDSKHIRVIQFGGSVIRYHLNALEPYKSIMSTLDNFIESKEKGVPIVLTVGGGPSLDLVRYYNIEFKFNQNAYDEMYFNAVCLNAKFIAGLLGKNGEYLTPKDIRKINLEYLLQKIPVISHFEEPWDKTKPFSSDLQAVLVAEYLKAPNVIMLRDVDGIHLWDPKIDSRERLEETVVRQEAYIDYIRRLRQVVTNEEAAARKKEGRKRYLFKIGGSAFDLVFYRKNPQVLTSFLSKVIDLHQDNDIILTVGGGPSQDIAKRFKKDMKVDDKTYQDISYHALKIHALLVAGMLEKYGEYVPPEDIIKVNDDYLREKIPVFSHIPNYLGQELFGVDIPYSQSDAATNALGEFLRVKKIFYVKNTGGIYPSDPNAEPRLSEKDIIRKLSIDKIYSLSRIGEDGMDEHLIENLGLLIFQKSKNYKQIHVIDIKDPNSIEKAFKSKAVGSVIYNPK